MVGEIRLYIEGGGDAAQSKRQLRMGFHQFLKDPIDASRARRVKFSLILCGGRNAAFDAFSHALVDHPDAFNVLLVDAEQAVASKKREHLKARDGWLLDGIDETQCHLMVHVMETWFLADPEKLKEFYSDPKFQPGSLPNPKTVEAVDKDRVYHALKNATRHTQKGEYQKVRHASGLLATIRAAEVRKASPHADELFKTLDARIHGG